MLSLWVRLGRGCAEVHHGTVLKTLLLLLSAVTGLHRILGHFSFFFFFNGRYCFFYRPLRGCAGFQLRILFFFFFVTDTIASFIGYYGVAEDSGSKSFFFKKMVPQSNSTGYQFSLTRIASGQYVSSFSTGSEQQKRWINKDGKLIKVLDITEA